MRGTCLAYPFELFRTGLRHNKNYIKFVRIMLMITRR